MMTKKCSSSNNDVEVDDNYDEDEEFALANDENGDGDGVNEEIFDYGLQDDNIETADLGEFEASPLKKQDAVDYT